MDINFNLLCNFWPSSHLVFFPSSGILELWSRSRWPNYGPLVNEEGACMLIRLIRFFDEIFTIFAVADLQSKHSHLRCRNRHSQKLLTKCRRPACISIQNLGGRGFFGNHTPIDTKRSWWMSQLRVCVFNEVWHWAPHALQLYTPGIICLLKCQLLS